MPIILIHLSFTHKCEMIRREAKGDGHGWQEDYQEGGMAVGAHHMHKIGVREAWWPRVGGKGVSPRETVKLF